MRAVFAVYAGLSLAGCHKDRSTHSSSGRGDDLHDQTRTAPLKRGLSAAGQEKLIRLLGSQTDMDRFAHELEKVASSGGFESVLIVTHAMLELPWIESLKPLHRYDVRMPKVAVERRLDQLVGAVEHDCLSACYFRALVDGRGDPEEAATTLLDWTLHHRDRLKWDGKTFWLRQEPDGQPQDSHP